MALLHMQKTLQGYPPQPGLSCFTLSEVFVETVADAAALGFALALLPRGQRPVLWVQDRVSRKES